METQYMDTFNELLVKTLNKKVPYYEEVINYLQENKGKQIRSKLSLLCAMLGGELQERSYTAAMIVEMLHTASLLHDDIVDNSIERRGVPSVKEKWDEKIAVISGDILSLRALLLSLSDNDHDLLTVYAKAIEQIVKGELLQLKKSIKLNTVEDTYFEIIRAKTAVLISAACEAGAITTNNDATQIEKLRMFGEYVGIAFQIKDDLFGYGNDNVGKPNDNDFKERKLTLPIIYTLNTVSAKRAHKLKRILKKKSISDDEVSFLIQEVKDTGGIEYTVEKMHSYGKKAIALLTDFPDSEIKNELIELVKYTTNRAF